jgi:uncharacterized membrane protein
LNQAVVKRFTPMVWTAIVLIAVTGLIRAGQMGALSITALTSSPAGHILSAKMALFLIMFIAGLVITATGRKLSKNSTREYVAKAQRRIKILSETNIVLGVIVILLSVMLD